MIGLFRRIRKKLADDNKPMKYMKYAIGEIFLVMVGILLALQVNTWNEYKKDRILEKKVLENLVENLENNQRRLERGIKSIDRYRKSGSLVLSVLEDGKTYPDSINLHIHRAIMDTGNMRLSKIGYDFFNDAGFGIIQNELLSKKITVYFENNFTNFHKSLSWEERGLVDKDRFIDEYFLVKPRGQGERLQGLIYLPYNKNELLENNYFHSLISKTKNQRRFFKNVMSGHIEKIEELLLSIRNELKSFK